MDNILFVNEFSVDNLLQNRKNIAKEVYFYWTFKRPIQIAKMVFTSLVILNYLWCLSIGYIPTPLSWFSLALMVASFPISYFTSIRRYIRRQDEVRYKELETISIRFSDDAIYPSVSNESYYLELSSMKFAYTTKNYIVLVTKNKNMFLLNKSGFVKGDYNSFCQFLESKNIKVKG